ncbi:MAG TPA: hypothetical protein VF753_14770, partial [Terriglobales bacterium]
AHSARSVIQCLGRHVQATAPCKPQHSIPQVFPPQQHENNKDEHDKTGRQAPEDGTSGLFKKFQWSGFRLPHLDGNRRLGGILWLAG